MHQQKITQLEILSGWKDIANYMQKGVRTVQRYELEFGLPIRRPAGTKAGSVIATKPEIDAWISARPIREAFRLPPHLSADSSEIRKELRQQVTELHRLQEQAAQLRQEMSTAPEAVEASIHLLHERLGLSAGESQPPSRRPTALSGSGHRRIEHATIRGDARCHIRGMDGRIRDSV
jgi:hypothetical protein